ncbi:MAG: pyridoxal-phosphate-dependent aminotransferase family protein [Thermoprotei archaeon]
MSFDDDELLLLTPGPVSVHPRVLKALSNPIRYHRNKEFLEALDWVSKFISKIEGTQNLTIPLTGSGTAAMDAALSSISKPHSRILSLVNGVFSKRMYDIAKYYSDDVVLYEKVWGKAITKEDAQLALEKGPFDIVTIVQNETSTGVLNPMKEIMSEITKSGAVSIVDGITAVGGDFVEVDKWGVDVMITASQKCIGAPPGMSFITISDKVMKALEQDSRGRSYYLDVRNYIKGNNINIPFTTSTPTLLAVGEALKMIEEEGINNRIARHRLMAQAVRTGLRGMGLSIFAEEGYESNTVTAVNLQNSNSVVAQARQYGVLFAEGQGILTDKILRFGHMNLVGKREVLIGLATLELALKDLNANFIEDKGVLSALKLFESMQSQ